MGGGGQQQLQQLSQELEAIDEEIAELEAEIEDLRTRQSEIDEATEAIETLDSGSMVQVPLGGGAYVRAEVQDIDEVIVDLGGGYAAEQEQNDAIDALERKKGVLDDRIDDVEAEISELESESDEIEQQAQQMQQQMQQQQMQQLQQQQEQGDE
ncbi:prefoldin subunit alpha [Haloplanus salinus]|jgi:prefoldin alpha subunit|uniref:Prefoldin subunit alpha n=2 Tax=root TaxID=1 RepID=A0A368NBP4_9EURY|nr:prefoldin subunit alpha [Haloplanus salinus]RCU47423.1 prefoldin subunit alpha [Haloplanus salinus]